MHLAACEDNLNYITYLLDKGADINAKNNLGNTPLIDAAKQKNKESISLLISLGADLNLINNQGKTALDVALSLPGFKRVWTTMVKVGAKTTAELSSCIVSTDSLSLLVENTKNNIEAGEQWADQFRGYISTLSVEQVSPWQSLIRHCLDNNSSKPSKRWLKQAHVFVGKIGIDVFRDQLLVLIPSIKEKCTSKAQIEHDSDYYYYDEETLITESNTRLLKRFIWLASDYNDADVSRELRLLASQMYKKIYGIGLRNAKLGNAAIYSLSIMEGSMGVKEIIILRSTTKYNPALVNINRVFNKLAESRGLTPDELAELSIPDYDLTSIGLYTETIGEFTAKLQLISVGKTELIWIKGEKSQKIVPAAIKKDYINEIKLIKGKAKDIQTGSRAHSQCLEQFYLRVYTQECLPGKNSISIIN